jgi:predicted transcriptional regulator
LASTTLRASYTFSAPILQRFNAVVPHGERSRVMEDLMRQALAVREAQLAAIAEQYMADPAFAECREDEKRWEVTVADGMEDA